MDANNSALPYISNADYVVDLPDPSIIGLLQRRIAPEKQILNAEEIKSLVENDELSKVEEERQRLTSAEKVEDVR